jgi:D-alanyl-D-alanine carboxypeptidase
VQRKIGRGGASDVLQALSNEGAPSHSVPNYQLKVILTLCRKSIDCFEGSLPLGFCSCWSKMVGLSAQKSGKDRHRGARFPMVVGASFLAPALVRGDWGNRGIEVMGTNCWGRGLNRGKSGGPPRLSFGCLAVIGLGTAALAAGPASPAHAARHWHRHRAAVAHESFTPVKASIVVDAGTGQVLSQSDADSLTYPASLTKMMTLYLTFEALNSGRLRLDQRLPVSGWAASRSPTKLGLVAGDAVSVRSLILGIVTRSANDAAVVLAEGIGGSEPAFAAMMNREARQLGMTRTHYANASGLPDPHQTTTARDQVQLALALYHTFPREFQYFSTREFVFRGRRILGHDRLLDEYPGADGIKTGYIHAAGFNLASSAVQGGHRLIGVVLGGRTARSRDTLMMSLLNAGFAELGVQPSVAAAQQPTRREASLHTATSHRQAAEMARAAGRLVAHLSPIGHAEAASLDRRSQAPVAEARWGVQLGAFHSKSAARRAGREAQSFAPLRGKPLRIVDSREGHRRLYRPRVLKLTEQQAIHACVELHKRGRGCWALRPPTVRLASQ